MSQGSIYERFNLMTTQDMLAKRFQRRPVAPFFPFCSAKPQNKEKAGSQQGAINRYVRDGQQPPAYREVVKKMREG